MKIKNFKYMLLCSLMYSCTPSDNSAYDKGYDTGFDAGYKDGVKKAEEMSKNAMDKAYELGEIKGYEDGMKKAEEEVEGESFEVEVATGGGSAGGLE